MRIRTKTVMEQMNAEKADDVLADLEAKHGLSPAPGSAATCTNWKCYKQTLWWMEVGDCRQTNNGFLVVKIKGWYCPKCGGSYGGNPPPNEKLTDAAVSDSGKHR